MGYLIISKLNLNDTAIVSCVSKNFKVWASDDLFWAFHCSNDLNLTSPLDPFGNIVPSFKVAYQIWREEFSMYPWPLVRRVKKCWDTIKTWLNTNFPEVLTTFRRGAPEKRLNRLEKSLKVKLPLSTRLLYRIHDGQKYSNKSLGLIGGYMVNGHVVNVNLLTVNEIIQVTKRIMKDFPTMSKYIFIAASSGGKFKTFSLNCENNQLYAATNNMPIKGDMMPCVPNALLMGSGDEQCDGMLLWLEEHGRRLESGLITTRGEGDVKSICQFPDKPPLCSTTVTNGVQVRASAVFIPEHSDLQTSRYMFAYSVRMCLLPEGFTIHGMTFNSCEHYMRHWITRENETVTSDIIGQAIIGKFPLLVAGEKEFGYECRTLQETNQGSIEGSCTFVPGRLDSPEGGPFEVEIGRFELAMPDYIF